MTAPTNHWKLGLFVLLSIALTLGGIALLGSASLFPVTVEYVSYFDESVEGLEPGSAVKFRGVRVGDVSKIDLASDKRHVQITYALAVESIEALGLGVQRSWTQETQLSIPADLRVQLVPTGITGVKFLQMDFFPEGTAVPELPFRTPPNTVPAVASTMKSLEASVVQMVDRFPEMSQQVLEVVTSINAILRQFEAEGVAGKLSQALITLNRVLEQVSQALSQVDPGRLSKDTSQALQAVSETLRQFNGEGGALKSLTRASDALGHTATQLSPTVEDTLRDVQRAARSVERLADAVEREPDMLIKGRAAQGQTQRKTP